MEYIIAVLVAVIGAFVTIGGYIWEKNKERESDLRKTRLEIHKDVIDNLYALLELESKILSNPGAPNIKAGKEWDEYVSKNHDIISKVLHNLNQSLTMLSVYGTDKAISAVAKFRNDAKALFSNKTTANPDLAQMVLELRMTLFPETEIRREQVAYLLNLPDKSD